MSKVNVRVYGDVWQKRLFKMQGRCLYYFKKETDEVPRGFIPLINIEVTDILPSKKVKHGFMIKITNLLEPKIAKRDEYQIQTDNAERKEEWKQAILANRARSVIGEPLVTACEVTTSNPDVHNLLPFFIPKFIEKMDNIGYRMRSIWTIDIPADIIEKYTVLMNLNYEIPLDDVHNAVGGILEYLNRLPASLLPAEKMSSMTDKMTWEQMRQIVLECPAPVRQLLKVLGLHFKKVVDAKAQNSVTQFSLLFMGPILIRSDGIPQAQAKPIQDNAVQVLVSNAPSIFEDVHMFLEAPNQPVLHRGRLIEPQTNVMADILEGARGLLVNVVRIDSMDWCTVYTANRRVGLVHKSNIKTLTPEEEKEMQGGVNVAAMMDVVREKMPEMMLFFDSMLDESVKLSEALNSF